MNIKEKGTQYPTIEQEFGAIRIGDSGFFYQTMHNMNMFLFAFF